MHREHTNNSWSVAEICSQFSMSRQAQYQWRRKGEAATFSAEIIVAFVLEKRYAMPRIGGRKLYYLIQREASELVLGIGRDAFFRILRSASLLVRATKNYCVTTRSHHWLRKYSNLIRGLVATHPGHILVSDITYIKSREGYCYLALVTDVYSRKILGYDLSMSLSAAGSVRALKLALDQIEAGIAIIHHSDRGFQYCSAEYVRMIKERGGKLSMTEGGNVYENALAERVNGILKTEFYLHTEFASVAEARRAVAEAIRTYNDDRPHLSLKMKTPQEMFTSDRKAA